MKPDDEQARRVEVERGRLARAIIDNPLWTEAYEKIAEQHLAKLLAEATSDEDTLELKRQMNALNRLKRHFGSIMQTGQMAQTQLNEDQNAKK